MDSQERAARSMLDGIAAGAIDRALLSDTFIFFSDLAGALDGAAFVAGVAQTKTIFRTPLVMTVTGITAQRGRLAAEAESRGELVDGNVYSNHYHWIFRFDERGLITRLREYANTKIVAELMWPLFDKQGGLGGHAGGRQ